MYDVLLQNLCTNTPEVRYCHIYKIQSNCLIPPLRFDFLTLRMTKYLIIFQLHLKFTRHVTRAISVGLDQKMSNRSWLICIYTNCQCLKRSVENYKAKLYMRYIMTNTYLPHSLIRNSNVYNGTYSTRLYLNLYTQYS